MPLEPALLFCSGKVQSPSPYCCRAYIRKMGSALLLSCPLGWFTCTPNNRISSSVLPSGVHGQLPYMLWLVRGNASSLTLVTPISFPCCRCSWVRKGGHLSLTHANAWQTRGEQVQLSCSQTPTVDTKALMCPGEGHACDEGWGYLY